MSGKLTTLEEFMKKYINNKRLTSGADSFDTYKHKNGINYDRSFSKGVEALYNAKNKNLATYGRNYRDIKNKGLQNSGYAQYINDKSKSDYTASINNLMAKRNTGQSKALTGYASYLERFTKEQNTIKNRVASSLIKNGVVDLYEAVAYGISQGLSQADALAVGQNAYSTNKRKVFADILEQVASLGLDKEGAVMLAKKMGVSDGDADEFGIEVEEFLKHYKNLSEGYLEYLEEKANKTTNTFN